ncbi:MAG: hypothetical protein PWQ88_570 [Candidatus Methanomethylophilaceae archaeon]|nr:hypothetical protein [Candidatus Methanomethylophilaceae archaeon]MDI3541595.1 hypothetical protein [Candidatus Methanomethylophilaceae archaeon]
MAVAAALGIGPALIVLYVAIGPYTYPYTEKAFFEDRKLFLLLAVGMMIGIVLFSAYTWFSWSSLIVAVGYAVVMEMVKVVILNLPRFQRRLDTVFYGTSLGVGIGATFAFGMAFYLLSLIGSPEPLDWIVVLLLSVQQVLLHSATGATIGEGVVRDYAWGFLAQAIGVNLVFQFLMLPLYNLSYPIGYITLLVALLFLIWYWWLVHKRRVPSLVKQAVKQYGL